jgi:hypothetical protein
MTEKLGGSWEWARRWPRYVDAILLAAAVQAGLGAWGVSGEADAAPLAAYLGGCAVTAGIIGLVLCLAPLHASRECKDRT